jgi:hypothetical protein
MIRAMSREEERELVLDAVDEAWNEFVHYSRKLDKRLPYTRLRELVRDGVVTKDVIVAEWKRVVEAWDLGKP